MSCSASPESISRLLSASCRPPPLPCPDATTSHRLGPSAAWVLLEPLAYVADRTNATTSEASSSTGHTVQVTFCLADPPGVSCVCIHCPGLKDTDFAERPRIVCSEKDLFLLRVTFKFGPHAELGLREYFIYKAGPGRPSLHLLPDPHPLVLRAWEVGLVPRGDDAHFVMAALCLTQTPWVYHLHLFSSMTWAWSTKVPCVEISSAVVAGKPPGVAHKVISLGGGTLGWVDLFWGILLCNVLDEIPVVRFIVLPMLMPGNKENFRVCPWMIRDVACSNGLIKFIEVQNRIRQADDKMSYYGVDTLYDSDCLTKHKYVGWRVMTWYRMTFWNYWRKGECLDYDEEISVDYSSHSLLLPELRHVNAEELTLKSLLASYPVLSLNCHSGDIVYLLCKIKSDTQKAWLITVDLKKKLLLELAPFCIEGYFSPAYPCSFSKYLNRSLASC